MSKIFHLIDDLKSCYQEKAFYVEDYLKLSQSEKNNLCKDVRKALVDYVNSPEYSFSDIGKNLLNFATSKYKIAFNTFN